MAISYEELGNILKVIYPWTSDESGDAAETTRDIAGKLVKASTNPDGDAAPSDDYDVVLTDEDGINILAVCDDDLADRDTANSEEVYFFVKDHAGSPLAQPVHPVVNGPLTITISNAGDTKEGVVNLYLDVGRKH